MGNIAFFLFVTASCVISIVGLHEGQEHAEDFANLWVVRVKRGSKEAKAVASDFAMDVKGPVC